VIICGSLSCGISSVFAVSSMLCHTLSLNIVNSFSSFVDKGLMPSGEWECWYLFCCCLYIVENFGARLVVWFWICTVFLCVRAMVVGPSGLVYDPNMFCWVWLVYEDEC